MAAAAKLKNSKSLLFPAAGGGGSVYKGCALESVVAITSPIVPSSGKGAGGVKANALSAGGNRNAGLAVQFCIDMSWL